MDEYISVHVPNFTVLKTLRHIVSCRTPALGAAVYGCVCGEQSFVFHSCRDRHCPVCQNINNARWAEKQMASSLPVKYFHIVFTLPDIINQFVFSHPKQAFGTLFDAASSALLTLCADRQNLGTMPGFTAVLHTWGQTMQFHPHLHVLITAGGISDDGHRFLDKSNSGYLLPVKALSKLFRGIFIESLDKKVSLPPDLQSSLCQREFFCYLKDSIGCADNVVKYLSRYAHRVCISSSRVASYDRINKTVTFSYKDNKEGGKQKIMTLRALEFMRRFLLHILPSRFMKIRHYGLLNNRGKFGRLQICRRSLKQNRSFVIPKARYFVKCPKCSLPLTLFYHMDALNLKNVLLC